MAIDLGADRSSVAVVLDALPFSISSLPVFFEFRGGGELLPSLEMLRPRLLKKSPIGFAGACGPLRAKPIKSAIETNFLAIAKRHFGRGS
ncbi:MAG: hypothetical protein ACREIF_06365 [Chthoniobacterales bacterium]